MIEYENILKFLSGGVFIAGLSLLIQNQHYKFERLKESRKAYSDAKTGADYLELRLCTLTLAEASAFVQQVHIWKHCAELYPELAQHLKARGFYNPREWADSIYYKLAAARQLLGENVEIWDALTCRERLDKMQKELPIKQQQLKQSDLAQG
jgi:hypothetical protein